MSIRSTLCLAVQTSEVDDGDADAGGKRKRKEKDGSRKRSKKGGDDGA